MFYREFFAGLRALPGVVAAGGTTRMPLAAPTSPTPVRVEGQLAEAARLHVVGFRRTLHDYFAAMRIPVRRGQLFTRRRSRRRARGGRDQRDAGARSSSAAPDPIGRRLALGSDPDSPWLTVVGRRRRCAPRQPRATGRRRSSTRATSAARRLRPSWSCALPADPAAMATSVRAVRAPDRSRRDRVRRADDGQRAAAPRWPNGASRWCWWRPSASSR